MRRMLRPLILALAVIGAVAACQPVQAPGQADGLQNYTLGVVLPFSGSLGAFGTDFGKGVELAVEQMNAQLAGAGANVQFTIAQADTAGTPEGAAKAVQAVVQSSGAQVIIGPLTTGEVLGAKPFADDNQIVLVAPASGAPAGAIADDFIFRVMYPPDTFAAQAFIKLVATREYKDIVILQVDDPFGNGLSEIFTAAFTAAGGTVAVIKYPADSTDLSSVVTKLSAEVAGTQGSNATAVFCICFLADLQKALPTILLYQNLRTVDWLGTESLVNEALLQDARHAQFLAQTHFTGVTTLEGQTPLSQPFRDAFKGKFMSDPGPFTNHAYDAANIAMLSILSGGNRGKSVQKILPFIANHYIGTAVQTYLDANGDQAIAYYRIAQVNEEGSAFTTLGTFDGSTGEISRR